MSYKILFNSANGQNQLTGTDYTTSLTTLSNSVYFPFVHWDRMLPEGKFKLTWTYTGSGNVIKGGKYAKIRLEGLRIDNTFETTSNNGAANNIDLGILKEKIKFDNDDNANTNVGFLTTDLDDNEPIYLERRPDNGPLTIKILNPDDTLWYDDQGTFVGGFFRKSPQTSTNLVIRNIPYNARLFIGSQVYYNSGNALYNKILDFGSGFGNGEVPPGTPNSYLGTEYTYLALPIGFTTSGVTNRFLPNAPGHYILQLNFEKI